MEDPSQPPFTQTLTPASSSQTGLLGPGARATWSEDMELALVEALVLEVLMGKRAENGFKRESFVRLQTAVNLKNDRKLLDVQQVRTKYNLLKKKFDCFAELIDNSGFGWDDERGMPTAGADVWDRFLKAHPKAKEFRYKPFKYFSQLKEVLSGTSATGAGAVVPSTLSSLVEVPEDEVPWSLSDDDEELNIPTKRKTGRVDSPVAVVSSEEDSIAISRPARAVVGGTQKRKWIRGQKQSAGKAIADALLEMSNTATALAQTKTERAVEVVLREYDSMPISKKASYSAAP